MERRSKWPRITLLGATLACLGVAVLAGLDWIGIGPNLGLHFGYYGRFNRVMARIEANPGVQVVDTKLHRDMQLEDFYITVRMRDDRELRLRFEEAHTRPFPELELELEKAGL